MRTLHTPVLLLGGAVLALACGGAEEPAPVAAPAASPSTAPAPSAPALPYGQWEAPEQGLKANLTRAGWTVLGCESQGGEAPIYACEAERGQVWAKATVYDLALESDAAAMADNGENTRHTGTRVLDVEVFDIPGAKTLSEALLADGAAISSLQPKAAEAAASAQGWDVVNSSTSTDAGTTTADLLAWKDENALRLDWESRPGEAGALRSTTEQGRWVLEQGAHSRLEILILDNAAAAELIEELAGE